MSAVRPPATDDVAKADGPSRPTGAPPADHSSRAGGAQFAQDPSPAEHEPVGNIDRVVTAVITVAPVPLLGLAAWQAWNRELHWRDVAIFLVMYFATGLGVTIGFHRLLTHRAFKTSGCVRGVLAVLGTMSVEGPVISWVADHRRHHAYTDRPGDPHSPHVDHGRGLTGALRGLAHAHVGWLFDRVGHGSRERYAPDLLADPVVEFVDRTFIFWTLLGFALPFLLGLGIGGSVAAGLDGLLWGGAVRMLALHHVTYSINSLCHFFGRRRFATGDESRNLAWLAPLSFGEAWHNNHHAFPTSAFHGLRRGELDISAALIVLMERAGIIWDVQRVSDSRRAAKAL